MTAKRDRPPFIATQGIRLLAETDQPQRYLRAEYFRAGQSCRLPREYEWECAAKADTGWDRWDQNYWWGDEFDPAKCNGDRQVGRTTRPRAEHANAWGFADILGNVWEWCEDAYRRVYSRTGEPDSSARVLRGGAWFSSAAGLRSAYRVILHPADAYDNVGFRVARALLKS